MEAKTLGEKKNRIGVGMPMAGSIKGGKGKRLRNVSQEKTTKTKNQAIPLREAGPIKKETKKKLGGGRGGKPRYPGTQQGEKSRLKERNGEDALRKNQKGGGGLNGN